MQVSNLMDFLKCTFCGEFEVTNSHINNCKTVATLSQPPSKMSINQLLTKSKQREYKKSIFHSDSFPKRQLFREERNEALNEERDSRRKAKVSARKSLAVSK